MAPELQIWAIVPSAAQVLISATLGTLNPARQPGRGVCEQMHKEG